MTNSSVPIANWFIQRSLKEPKSFHCNQMKLYCLVYYAHAWHIGNKGYGLFNDNVRAWAHGPLVTELVNAFRHYKRDNIDKLASVLDVVNGSIESVTPMPDEKIHDFLEEVWALYGCFNGAKLTNMAHLPNEPWASIANKYNFDFTNKPVIPVAVIKHLYQIKVDTIKNSKKSNINMYNDYKELYN